MSITTFAEANAALRKYWPARSNRTAYTLDYMHELMAHLGSPQDTLKVIHVAGTSGKTSTAYYAAALLRAAGKKVGLTVSPHVDEVNERVQINLIPLPEAEFCRELSAFLEIVERSTIPTTYFEVLTAFMYWEFARQQVDYAVVEVGLGGLLDATNVVSRADKVCVITDIGLDHIKILGHTLPEIAAQKAGIMQLHNAVFCNKQSDEVIHVFQDRARQKQADLHILAQEPLGKGLAFLPLFQQRNFGLSLAVVNAVLERDQVPALQPEAVVVAAHTYVPGRMDTRQVNGKTLIMDGAHNQQKIHAFIESVRAKYPTQAIAAVVSFVADREGRVEQSMSELAKAVDHVIITRFSGGQDTPHGSVDPEEIIAACQHAGVASYEVQTDVRAAIDALLKRPEPILLVTGSFYMLHHVRLALADLPT